MSKQTISVIEVAEAIGLSVHSTYAALRAESIPRIRIGRRFIIPRAAFEEWLRSASQAAETKATRV
jgi:excisionase family DNA binding protein